MATPRDPDAARERRRRVDSLQAGARAEITLVIWQQLARAPLQGGTETYRTHGIGNRIVKLPDVGKVSNHEIIQMWIQLTIHDRSDFQECDLIGYRWNPAIKQQYV